MSRNLPFKFIACSVIILHLFSYSSGQTGFTSVTPITPINVVNQTQDKPQAKAWKYANQWWCCLSAVGGTKVFRLDSTSWTETLTLNTTASKPDCWVTGDLVHLLLYRGSNSLLYSVKYDTASNTYRLWSTRPTPVNVTFPPGSETATLVVDGTGRMWAATAGTAEIIVRWSDVPYSTWGAPITIATGVDDDDICVLTTIPTQNKIAILWSNQTSKRYGFRTHTDGTIPDGWSADEVPASQSALNVGKGMADDHLNIVVAADGTLYCAAKTGYDHPTYPESILLVRRPSGAWDDVYTISDNGTQAVVVLNEVLGKVKVVYSTATGGENIVYRESSTSNISFGSERPLINGVNILLNYATSTHETYNPDVVILATDENSIPMRVFSVLASDTPIQRNVTQGGVKSQIIAYPNPFNSSTSLSFTLPYSGDYNLSLYDSKGAQQRLLSNGWAEAGIQNTVRLDAAVLPSGVYMISLQTTKGRHTIKVILNK